VTVNIAEPRTNSYQHIANQTPDSARHMALLMPAEIRDKPRLSPPHDDGKTCRGQASEWRIATFADPTFLSGQTDILEHDLNT